MRISGAKAEGLQEETRPTAKVISKMDEGDKGVMDGVESQVELRIKHEGRQPCMV